MTDKFEIKREDFLKQRDRYIQVYRDNCQSLEKNLLFLSSGALTLSFTAIQFLDPYLTHALIWLKLSWAFFGVAIIITLLGIGSTIVASYKYINNWDLAYKEQQPLKHTRFNKITGILSFLSVIFFVTGIFFLVIFGCFNF